MKGWKSYQIWSILCSRITKFWIGLLTFLLNQSLSQKDACKKQWNLWLLTALTGSSKKQRDTLISAIEMEYRNSIEVRRK